MTGQSILIDDFSTDQAIFFNRSIDGVKIQNNSAGQPQLMAELDLDVGYDERNPNKNLSFEVQVRMDGRQVGGFKADIEYQGNDAIKCAVACQPGCGSIFGAGFCVNKGDNNCHCDYGGWFAIPTKPGILKPGTKLQLVIVPAPGAEKDIYTRDDGTNFQVPGRIAGRR